MLADLKFALRQLRKAPGFAATVVLTLAVGIGACTVIFTAINATLVEIVKGADFDRTILIHETQLPKRPQMPLSPPAYLDLEREAQSFEYLSAWVGNTLNLAGDVEPQRLSGAGVSLHTFAAWGVAPVLGRGFLPEEFTAGKQNVVVLSFPLWQRSFGGSPQVLGRKLLFDGEPFTVVGVLSERFNQLGSDLQAYVPLVFDDAQRLQQRGAHYLQVTGKLKAGVSVAQAQAEAEVFAHRFAQLYPDTNQGVGLLVRPFSTYLNRTLAPMLHILMGTVACVLLVACANVANLLLARASTRQREISIRAALGAGRGRIIRQLLVESILLALLGGALGTLFAAWGLTFIRSFAPSAGTDFARLAFVTLDLRMLAFTLGFSVLTGIVFGLAPAWLSSRVDLNEALKQGTRGSTEGRGRGRLRSTIAAMEIALALVLLTGAGLLIRSFVELARVHPGFVPERAATMRVLLRTQQYKTTEQYRQFSEALLARLTALPNVEAAALTNNTPIIVGGTMSFTVAGRPAPAPGEQPAGVPYVVTPDYFRAMGIRVLRGRTFTGQETRTSPRLMLISETLARQYFPNEDPLGRQINVADGPTEIIGIVNDVMQGTPGVPPPPQFYVPMQQYPQGSFVAIVRTKGEPNAVLASLKSQVYAIDREQPVAVVRTLEDWIGDTLARQRFMLNLLIAFAVIALAISSVGLYGVMAYSVSQRTAEFGIRMALGATASDVLRQVLKQGVKLIAIGLVTGLLATLMLGRLVESLLYNTSPRDPLTLALIAALLAATTFVACLVPARRATKVDPMTALRAE